MVSADPERMRMMGGLARARAVEWYSAEPYAKGLRGRIGGQCVPLITFLQIAPELSNPSYRPDGHPETGSTCSAANQSRRTLNGMAESFVNTFAAHVASMDGAMATVPHLLWPSSASTRCIHTRR